MYCIQKSNDQIILLNLTLNLILNIYLINHVIIHHPRDLLLLHFILIHAPSHGQHQTIDLGLGPSPNWTHARHVITHIPVHCPQTLGNELLSEFRCDTVLTRLETGRL